MRNWVLASILVIVSFTWFCLGDILTAHSQFEEHQTLIECQSQLYGSGPH